MRERTDGWLVQTVTDLLNADDSPWAEAVLAELPHVPPGRRTLWALGGLWSLLLRRPATGLIRVMATIGLLFEGLWLYASIGVLTDDAPDLRWPYNLWVVLAESVLVLVFALALIRPIIAAALALPAFAGYAWVMWVSASVNDGDPPLAVAIFVGFPAVMMTSIALMAILRPYLVASR